MYKTELTEKILTSPMAQKIIQEVSPLYGEAYTVLWLYQVIGMVLDDIEEWANSLEQQVVPQTATWALPYWEEQYNIVTDSTWSYERRRENIVNKCRNRAPLNPYKLERIVAVASGGEARVEEHTGKNQFTVYISAKESLIDEKFVRREIDKAKPAHLTYEIVYERYVEGISYMAGTIQTAKEITLTQY